MNILILLFGNWKRIALSPIFFPIFSRDITNKIHALLLVRVVGACSQVRPDLSHLLPHVLSPSARTLVHTSRWRYTTEYGPRWGPRRSPRPSDFPLANIASFITASVLRPRCNVTLAAGLGERDGGKNERITCSTEDDVRNCGLLSAPLCFPFPLSVSGRPQNKNIV